ncbi:high mobility group nucleosome-binding domain-containing protein 5 [Exaiptasia diaphana]|uniref:Uncharacterized protein n=1 Tax=Exaiptasia diaphana TaxID=2652724 RepID=A0A913X9C8_EXADI|nr:high mobility group nucleosome-binding domain-containing protein 5 [Exaiptasia diaphana]XP_020900436.1 high mobility group nucleosome-binding domain-containing protein 5 [Exaiptasia diaphana]KXJ14269.1 hypothetical protein AC249_AIPGENE5988 [Exaiptasia diaphana]KXJ14282.1 hypothetical protein AC249_AIPGENE5949 [Exaiptasia diaphana]
MAEVCPDLKRDSTMTVTAKEGEAFLETAGQVHEDAKTRAQQKHIEENANEEPAAEDSPSKLARTTTMAATAKEGTDLLDGEELGKTRAETETLKEKEEETNGAEHNGDGDVHEDEKPALKRDGTMQVTAKEGAELLEGHDTEAGTRAEAKAVQEAIKQSTEENGENEEQTEEEKPDLKRKSTMDATVEEGQEFIKKQKESDEAEVKA